MTKENDNTIIFFKRSLGGYGIHLHFKAYHLKRWMCEKMVKCIHVIKFILPFLEMKSDLENKLHKYMAAASSSDEP